MRHNDWPVTHEIRADLWRVLCNYKDFNSFCATYQSQLEEAMRTGGEFRFVKVPLLCFGSFGTP